MAYDQDWRNQRTAEGFLREHLENARMAEFVYAPKTDAARAFAHHLCVLTMQHEATEAPRRRRRQPAAQRDFEGAVAAFAADLIHHGQFSQSEGFMYRPSDKDQLGGTLVSVRSFDQLRKFWTSLGWMESTSSFVVRETWEGEDIGPSWGRAGRYRATPELLTLAEGFGISPTSVREHFERQMGRVTSVVVRAEGSTEGRGNQRPLRVARKSDRYLEEVSRVSKINSLLQHGGFDLRDSPWVCRLFNRGDNPQFQFDMGGRLYCRSEDNWQTMRKEERRRITWKGEPTIELDVRASHLFILYAINGRELPADEDPYELPSIDRDLTKAVFVATMGRGQPPTRWPRGLSDRFKVEKGVQLSKKYKIAEVVDALFAKHSVMQTVSPGRLDWARLQYEESECFVNCLLRLGAEHGIAALPIHDSIIVALRHRDIAHRTLVEVYQERFKFTPVVQGSQ